MGFSERLAEMRREAEDRRDAAQRDMDKIAACEFTGQDADRSVRVTIDGHGTVRAVRLNPKRVAVIDGNALGGRVVEAVRAARRAAVDGTRDARERIPGGDADLRRSLKDGAGLGRPPVDVDREDSKPDDIDALMDELRRFRARLPAWADELAAHETVAESAGGAVRATCTASGKVTRVKIETYFPRTKGPDQIEAAILSAMQRAQAAAARRVAAHQEKLTFMGLPIGEVVSGKRSLADLLRVPPNGVRTEEQR